MGFHPESERSFDVAGAVQHRIEKDRSCSGSWYSRRSKVKQVSKCNLDRTLRVSKGKTVTTIKGIVSICWATEALEVRIEVRHCSHVRLCRGGKRNEGVRRWAGGFPRQRSGGDVVGAEIPQRDREYGALRLFALANLSPNALCHSNTPPTRNWWTWAIRLARLSCEVKGTSWMQYVVSPQVFDPSSKRAFCSPPDLVSHGWLHSRTEWSHMI